MHVAIPLRKGPVPGEIVHGRLSKPFVTYPTGLEHGLSGGSLGEPGVLHVSWRLDYRHRAARFLLRFGRRCHQHGPSILPTTVYRHSTVALPGWTRVRQLALARIHMRLSPAQHEGTNVALQSKLLKFRIS